MQTDFLAQMVPSFEGRQLDFLDVLFPPVESEQPELILAIN